MNAGGQPIADVVRLIRTVLPEVADRDVVPVRGAGTTSVTYRIAGRWSARFPIPENAAHRYQSCGAPPTSGQIRFVTTAPDRTRPAPAVPGQARAVTPVPGQAGAVTPAADQLRAAIVAEHLAMREFAAASPVPSPLPVAVGEPDERYPFPWSLQTWVDGDVADPVTLASSTEFALDLADLVAALRAADTRGRTFSGPGRGGDLTTHEAWVADCLANSDGLLPVRDLRRLWSSLRTLPRAGGRLSGERSERVRCAEAIESQGNAVSVDPDVMSHKDLIPANILVRDGRLAGVIDTGGFGPADPALDLVAAWHMLDADARDAFRARLGVTDAQWRRGAAWAFEQAIGLVWYYVRTNPTMSELGRTTLARLLDEADQLM